MDYSNASNEDLEQLINHKDGEAMCEMAKRYMEGTKGNERKLTRAYQLLHKGEKLGCKTAYAGLSYMYENGVFFAKSLQKSIEYKNKADGVPWICNINVEKEEQGENLLEKISVLLNEAESFRVQGNYSQTKALCHEVFSQIEKKSGNNSHNELELFRIRAYFILAFTAFNEQNLSELEKNAGKQGVKEFYPWVVYLLTIMHRIRQSPQEILEKDLGSCMQVCENENLSDDERGDIFVVIGDLLSEGYGEQYGNREMMAKEFYERAAGLGNLYAKEQFE